MAEGKRKKRRISFVGAEVTRLKIYPGCRHRSATCQMWILPRSNGKNCSASSNYKISALGKLDEIALAFFASLRDFVSEIRQSLRAMKYAKIRSIDHYSPVLFVGYRRDEEANPHVSLVFDNILPSLTQMLWDRRWYQFVMVSSRRKYQGSQQKLHDQRLSKIRLHGRLF